MKRKEDESFEQYWKRRKKQQLVDKAYAKGRLFWDSKTQGTYIKPKELDE